MFKNFRIFLAIIFFIGASTQNNYAQISDKTTQDLKENAFQQFTAQDYNSAYQSYKKLLIKYPKDGLYNYYAGLCLYFQNKDINRSIEYLSFASGKPQVPSDVFYYLGYAYRKNYMFKESKAAFSKFNSIASRTEVKDLMPAREAEISGNAMIYTLEYNPFEIISASFISFSDSISLAQISGKGGVLSKRTGDLLFGDALENNLSSLIFLPKEISRGTVVYFSAYGNSKKKGLELYKVKKMTGKKWGDPEAINELNTDYDEIMPYYDPISKDLYFASKAYNSIGGFDVFKSHYDEERDSWGEPASLGFPVNSPQNEFLAMPGYDLGTIMVITDRQGLGDSYAVYRLKISEPKKSLSSAGIDELSRIGNFGGVSFVAVNSDLKNTDDLIVETKEPENKIIENVVIIENPTIESAEIDPFTEKVNTALSFQSKSDSLSQLAKKARLEVKAISDPEARWNIQKKIIEWESLSIDYQEKANQSYSLLDEKKTVSKPEVPAGIKEKNVINDIIVYEYSDEIVNRELNKIDEPENLNEAVFDTRQEPGDVVKEAVKPDSHLSRFVILKSSPYNSNNPIPLDLKIPDGSFYRIQLGAFGSSVSPEVFGGLSPMTAESIEGKNLTRYFVGKFSRYSEAIESLSKVKSAGFKDAYIVGWYNGEKMSIDRVREFEKRER